MRYSQKLTNALELQRNILIHNIHLIQTSRIIDFALRVQWKIKITHNNDLNIKGERIKIPVSNTHRSAEDSHEMRIQN